MRLCTEDVTWQETDGELVILDLARSTYLTTNKTGAFLAKLLHDETSEDELPTALGAHCDIATDTVRAFIQELTPLQILA